VLQISIFLLANLVANQYQDHLAIQHQEN